MQILFLFLVPLFFGCGKTDNIDTWKTPNIRFLTKSSGKLIEASANSHLSIDDYISFEESKATISNVKALGKSKCKSGDKSFSFQRKLLNIPFQIKSVVSPKAYLYESVSSCDLEIILKNSSGSTKNFRFKKVISSEDHLSEMNIPEIVGYSDFHNTILQSYSKNNLFGLHCENFESEMGSARSISLNELVLSTKLNYKNIPIQSYNPRQRCRVVTQSENGTKWSYVVTLNFKTIRPHFRVTHVQDFGYSVNYIMQFSNPYSVPISFGLKKQDFKFSATCRGACNKVPVPQRRYEANVSFPPFQIIYGNKELYVVALKAGGSTTIKVQVSGRWNPMASHRIVPDFDPKSVGAYDLEYNYRHLSEIGTYPPRLMNKFYPL